MSERERRTPNLLIPALIGGVLGALVFYLTYPNPEWLVVFLFPGEILMVAGGGNIDFAAILVAGLHYALYGLLTRVPGVIAKRSLIVLLLAQAALGAYLLMWAGVMPH